MTAREIKVAKCILDAAHDYDGGQAHALTLHADATLRMGALIPMNEFNEVFQSLNAAGCFNGVATKFKGTLWSLTPKGEQTRLEMT
jgi:hypothetical protein